MIDGQHWGLRATRYGNPHACLTEGQPRGCTTATVLRAVYALLEVVPEGTGVDLQLTHSEAAPVLRQWLDGDTTMPAWYNNDKGTLNALATELSKTPPGLITVSVVSVDESMLTAAAYQLAEAGRRAYDRHGGMGDPQLDTDIEQCLGAFNA